ncbi:MAG: alpha/beta fold hydrolase [Deltaproteobacteria bacterium]|nr:alpha/beta fold hydrolase [Deltaproteobacteria bacterium]
MEPQKSRRSVRKKVAQVMNGLSLLVDGSARVQLGSAPNQSIYKAFNLEVLHILPRAPEEGGGARRTPVLLIPPLAVRPYVYDLRPDHSMVRVLRDFGLDVYVLDFGVPRAVDRNLTLDHYVFTFLPQAIDAVRRHAGAETVHLAGYCMGGLFALLYTAARGERVRSVVTVGAPINFDKLGVLTLAAHLGKKPMDALLERLGNVPSFAAEAGFKLMGGTRTITKWADLVAHLDDDGYVRGFDAINTWVNDLLPYPGEAFRQLLREVVTGNKLLKGGLVLADREVNLRRVEAPLLAFSGRTDNIATPEATRAILECVGSRDKSLREVPGGHVGVIAGSEARTHVWEPAARWLVERA